MVENQMVKLSDGSFVEVLGDENYATWKVRVRFHLLGKGLWSLVSSGLPKDANDELKQKDQLTLGYLGGTVSTKYLSLISKCTTSKEAWEQLEAVFASKGVSRKMQMLRQMMQLKMHGGEKLAAYITRAQALVNALEDLDFKVSSLMHTAAVLNGLPKTYEMVVTVMETAVAEPDISAVTARLMEFEARMDGEIESMALAAVNRPSGCWLCGEKGHIKKDCPQNKAKGKVFFALPTVKPL